MSWFTLAIIGMVIWSFTAMVDRFALSNNRVSSKRFYVLIPALVQFPLVLLFLPLFTPTSFDTTVIIVGLLGGMLEIVFLYYMFVAISSEEVGRVFPLMSLGTIVTLLGGWLIFNDTLTQIELIALFLLSIGGVVMAFKKTHNKKGYTLSKGIPALLLSTTLSSAYILSLRFVFIKSDFATGFFFSRIGFFIGGIILFIVFRREILTQWKQLRNKMKLIVVGNQIFSFSGHTFYFSALALANAGLVQSVLSIQSVIIFITASAISYFNPSLLSESIARNDLIQKGIAILLIVLAINLLI